MNLDNVQRAIYTTLTGNAALMALIEGVYADVPQAASPENDSPFPFIVIGQDDGEVWDTKTDHGARATCSVRIWTRSGNLLEVKDIGHAVYSALHRKALTIAGANFVSCTINTSTYFPEPDGFTQQGVLSFEVLYDEI